MGTAFFDLDNTLIGGDTDYLWGEYLADIGVVAVQDHRRENERFLREYHDGKLNQAEFLAFQLRPLAENSLCDLLRWRTEFIRSRIAPLLLPKAMELLADHRTQGHRLVIVTSTNRFITEPVAALLGVHQLLATEPEFDGKRYSGRTSGVPCAGTGKVFWVERWRKSKDRKLTESWFYTDSYQDLPLLEHVDHPVAVDPDARLGQEARARGWPVISLR